MTLSIIGCQKNPIIIPKYAYIVETYDEIWQINRMTRYPICWKIGCNNLYSTVEVNLYNKVVFTNIDCFGGFKRIFVNSSTEDRISEAFANVYCKSTKELLIIGLYASEARYGGIVIQPLDDMLKVYRHKHLMNKWRKLTPLIGKWRKFLIQLHDEVVFRPGNSGAKSAYKRFRESEEKMNMAI